MWVSLHRQSEKDQARKKYRAGGNASSVAVPNRFQVLIPAIDVEAICYCEIFSEKQTVSAARRFIFLERFINV